MCAYLHPHHIIKNKDIKKKRGSLPSYEPQLFCVSQAPGHHRHGVYEQLKANEVARSSGQEALGL